MKISKIKHTRTAVGKTNADNIQGMIYAAPSTQRNAIKDLDTHVTAANKTAQILYGVFSNKVVYNPPKRTNKKEGHRKTDNKSATEVPLNRIEKNIVSAANKSIKNYFKFGGNDFYTKVSQEWEKNTSRSYIDDDLNKINRTAHIAAEDIIEEICEKRIKKSLMQFVLVDNKKIMFSKLFAKMIYSLIYPNDATKALSQNEKNAIKEHIQRDYNKTDQLKKIVRSIELKNVKVQVDNSKLVLSSAIGVNEQKKCLFEFIKDFANGNKDVKIAKLRHIKALILLYVCGAAAYEDARISKGNVWTWDTLLPESNENFSDTAYEKAQEIIALEALKENKKAEIQQLTKEIKSILENKIAVAYREAINIVGDNNLDKYWLKYFQELVEKLLKKNSTLAVRLGKAYLCKELFREWLSYVAMKYVDMGKAVYHFAMPDLYNLPDNAVMGEVQPRFKNGITSFDYERIKAEESITRNFAISATYAATSFANSVADEAYRLKSGNEDVLGYRNDEATWQEAFRRDALRRVLQFFGGKSKWTDEAGNIILEFSDKNIVHAIKDAISIVRNHSYHYTPRPAEMKSGKEVIKAFFDVEYKQYSRVFAEKYYSNNVPFFYKESDIKKALDALYDHDSDYPAQIPSFSNVLSKKLHDELLPSLIGNINKKGYTAEELKKLRSAVYFVFKDIYYRGLLQENDIYNRFDAELKNEFNEVKKNNDSQPVVIRNGKKLRPRKLTELSAIEDFDRRIKDLKNASNKDFPAVCQQIMTDVNMQNQGNKSIKTAYKKQQDKTNGKKEVYQHFKMLLYKVIRRMFVEYLKEKKVFSFLFNPSSYDKELPNRVPVNKFCENWQANCFTHVKKLIDDNPLALPWYAIAHFMPAKQLNALRGDIKSYKQYIVNINERAKSTGNSVDTAVDKRLKYYQQILQVLDFVSIFSGRISNEVEDYFDSKLAYKEYLEKFVAFDVQEVFFDAVNPKINRGIAQSVMYGMGNILEKIDYMVADEEYQKYKRLVASDVITRIFKDGKCNSEDDQKKLNEFQQLKNRIELHDLLKYTEMISDHMSQLVSFAYMRERDLMYFQLGVHYIRMYHGNSFSDPASRYRMLAYGNTRIADGALLYQLVAIYAADLPLYIIDEKGKVKACGTKAAGSSVGKFGTNYDTKYQLFTNSLGLFVQNDGRNSVYEQAVSLRNSIDHMKYFSNNDKSIMDYYSDIYNLFFCHDTSLRKSVSYIFKNIMMHYFLEPKLKFISNGSGGISIEVDNLISDKFQYNFDGKKFMLNAKSDKFIDIAKNLLNTK